MRIPKSPYFPFYDFSTIFYEFTNFSKHLTFHEKEKEQKPKSAWALTSRPATAIGPPQPSLWPTQPKQGRE
jgi:hypothetical protein